MDAAIHHLDLVVTSLDRSLAFYRDALGWTEESEIVGERGERVVYIWRSGRGSGGVSSLGLRERQSDAHAVPYERYAVGVHHIFSPDTKIRILPGHQDFAGLPFVADVDSNVNIISAAVRYRWDDPAVAIPAPVVRKY